MINLILKWELTQKIDYLGDIFLFAFGNIQKEFEMKFRKKQEFEDHHSIISFKKETDWSCIYQDRTVNCIYPCEAQNLKMVYIDKNKAKGINIRSNHYYVFPYWLSYKLISENEEEQKVLNFWYWSDLRTKNKYNNYYW